MERKWRERTGPAIRSMLTPEDRWSLRIWQAIETGPDKLRSTLGGQETVDAVIRRRLDNGFNPVVVAAAVLSIDGWSTDRPTISSDRFDNVKKKFRAIHNDPAYSFFDVLIAARLLTMA